MSHKMDVMAWSPTRMLRWGDFGADSNPAAYEDAYSAIRYRPRWVVSSVGGATTATITTARATAAAAATTATITTARAAATTTTTASSSGDSGTGNAGRGGKSADPDAVFFVVEDLCIDTEFWPCLSWTRALDEDDCAAALNHQQGHFDLGELVMRREIGGIRDSVYGRRFPTRGKNEDQRKQLAKEDSALVVEPVVASLEGALEKERELYDRDTRHGDDLAAQSRYDKLFASLRA